MTLTEWEVLKRAFLFLGSFSVLLMLPYLIFSRGRAFPWVRVTSWVVLFTVLMGVLALPPLYFALFLAGLIFLGIEEIFRAVKAKNPAFHHPFLRVFTLAVSSPVPLILYFQPSSFAPYLLFTMLGLFLIPVLSRNSQAALDRVSRGMASLLFAVMLSFLVLLRKQTDGLALCLFLIFVTNITDTSAFLFGRLLGSHKMIPKISPGKTWEGAIAALGVAGGAGLLIRIILLPQYSPFPILLLSLGIGVLAQAGDLIFSVFKRDVGIKDYGQLIPGHGGILDRFDSLVVAAPIIYYFVKWGVEH